VSEALGLKWSDIDWKKRIITIQRSAYRGAIEDTKTLSSAAKLPLDPALAMLLERWRLECESERESESDPELEWVFANPSTGMPYLSPMQIAMFDSGLNHRKGQFRVLTWMELVNQIEAPNWLERYLKGKF